MTEWIIACAAAGAFGVSLWNTLKIRELHIIVNSRLTELLQITATSARAEGRLAGEEERKIPPS